MCAFLVYIIRVTNHVFAFTNVLRSDKIRNFFVQSTSVQNPLSPRLLNDVKTRQTVINKNMLLCTEVENKVFTRREKIK